MTGNRTVAKERWMIGHRTTFYPSIFSAERTVFFISITMVIGPTPPGTGVIADAFSFTA
jgi:hypothetical protein